MALWTPDITFDFNAIQSKHNREDALNPLAAASKLFEHNEVPFYQLANRV